MSSTISSSLAEQYVVLGNVAWSTYEALVEQTENPRGRMVYDNGDLEIMSPSINHEQVKTLIGRMIEMYTWKRRVKIRSAASTTFKLSKRKKGFEADESYYVQNASSMMGVDQVDLKIHPPPDIAVKVDISRSSILKMNVFAGLGVPEVWRYRGERITIEVLEGKKYVAAESSLALPGFPIGLASELIELRGELDENELLDRFMAGLD